MGAGRWGPLCVATEKNVIIAKVHSITLRFVHEDLVKTKLCIKVYEKSKDKTSYVLQWKISKYIN